MTDKEMNRAILSELVKIADEVFAKTTIKAGTYTAAELQRGKDANGNPINYALAKELDHKSYEVCVDGFRCSFLACQVFNFVWRFEQLAGVKSSEKKRFVKMSEVKRGIVCSFYVNIEKSHTSLGKLVSDDPLRPVLTQIFLDAQNRCLVASDGHVMKQMSVRVESETEIPSGLNLYINPKDIKNMVGKNRIDVYGNGGLNETVITNLETGTYYRNRMGGRFPNYLSVYPMLRRDGYIQFSKKEIKSLIQFCKCASKEAMNATMTMYVEMGSSKVLFSYSAVKDNSIKERYFRLDSIAEMTVRIGISGEFLANMSKDWNGGMWIVDPCKAVILDYKDDSTGLIMPKMIDDAISPEPGECTINPFDRNKSTIEATPELPEPAAFEAIPKISDPADFEVNPELQEPVAFEVTPELPEPEISDENRFIEEKPSFYEDPEKSPAPGDDWPFELRILLAILQGFGLIQSPLRYEIARTLQTYMERMIPEAVRTDSIIEASRLALSPDPMGALFLCERNRVRRYSVSPYVFRCNQKQGSGSPGGSSGFTHRIASLGIHAALETRGGSFASFGCGGRSAGLFHRASLPLPYALWDLSRITRPTGVSPPGNA